MAAAATVAAAATFVPAPAPVTSRPPPCLAWPVYKPFVSQCNDKAHVHILLGAPAGQVKQQAAPDTKEATQMVSEYGRDDLQGEAENACRVLGRPYTVHRVTIPAIPTLFASMTRRERRKCVVMNLCDGTETDGYPGISVVRRLESLGMAFTGADSRFYDISTSKVAMKRRFDEHKVGTAGWLDIPDMSSATPAVRDAICAKLDAIGYPLLVKPDISYNSCGITPKSKVSSAAEALEAAARTRAEFGSVYAEQFITGREFTVLVCGDKSQGVRTYEATERAFDEKIPVQGRFLHLDILWGTDQKKEEDDKWWYAKPPPELQPKLQQLAKDAFLAVHGSGYARVDIRMDAQTNRLAVLEVNANCGVGGWPNTSMGSIIEWSQLQGLPEVVDHFFAHACRRAKTVRRRRRARNFAIGTGVTVGVLLVTAFVAGRWFGRRR